MADHNGRGAIEQLIAPFRIDTPGSFRLADHDPAATNGIKTKESAQERLAAGIERLAELQDRLAAQQTYGLLVVIQALDAAGKDSAVKHVMTGVNPAGVRVNNFRAPSHQELAHHFLWRVDQALPHRGEIAIFNRSHYEEVLIVRVHPELLDSQNLPPGAVHDDIWKRRFREINDWEQMLVDNGFPIVKLFLHLSKSEQRRRLIARIDTPAKNWKFSATDLAERSRWDDYQLAYEDMIRHTSTKAAPWYVVPADNKWFTRVIVAEIVAAALLDIDPHYPSLSASALAGLGEARRQLEAEDLGHLR
jgi:PPK2 family polyphosphate:nucleotide phosphotransferase